MWAVGKDGLKQRIVWMPSIGATCRIANWL